ncbi:PIN domain-containing protein [Rhodothermus marinus]|uniref:PIN domain-containing protein n=1 Tax=Rhodothermus marinus TaxID=29549 RepID=UPI000A89CD08|nr:PIN domain-containing protein [Rhodothermus marinus]
MLGVSLLVLAETAYVLLSVYGVPRRQVIESLIWLLQKENLQPIGWAKSQVLQALMRCLPSGRVSIADALLWAEAHAHGVRQVYTFDRRFPDQRLTLLN